MGCGCWGPGGSLGDSRGAESLRGRGVHFAARRSQELGVSCSGGGSSWWVWMYHGYIESVGAVYVSWL